MPYGEQALWPDHCVQGSPARELRRNSPSTPRSSCCARESGDIDSYSAFLEADRKTLTGLAGCWASRASAASSPAGSPPILRRLFRARRARRWASRRFVVEDACRAIDANDSLAVAWARMDAAGVRRIASSALLL